MKWTTMILSLFVVAGCGKTTVQGPEGKELTLFEPADQTLERGETNEIAIQIMRSDWDGPVRVEFTGLPKGVSVIDLRDLNPSESRIGFTLQAALDADLVSNSLVHVTAHGPDGMKATESFRITVVERGEP